MGCGLWGLVESQPLQATPKPKAAKPAVDLMGGFRQLNKALDDMMNAESVASQVRKLDGGEPFAAVLMTAKDPIEIKLFTELLHDVLANLVAVTIWHFAPHTCSSKAFQIINFGEVLQTSICGLYV